MRDNFVSEISYLLGEIPEEQWNDPGICGVMYEFLPWHKMSSVTVQTRDDDVRDPAGWKYYFSAESDVSRLRQEIAKYEQGENWLAYHWLLLEAAEAFLSLDLSPFGRGEAIYQGRLFKPFKLQVYHADGEFEFNYCEHVLAKRLEAKA